jgi:predicted Fe-Mo cluster-binding NifX family protein
MKIAIPTDDKQTIAGHFGRTKGFMTFAIEDNKVVLEAYKPNNFTGHAQGLHDHDHGNHQHSHKGIFEALDGCSTVIARGMGRRLYDDFAAKNIRVFITEETDIRKAVDRYLEDSLDNNPDSCCSH